MKLKICLMGLLCLFFKAKGQSNDVTKSLKAGDTIPQITLSNIINYRNKSIRLADLKDKLVVFDFWSTSCSSCIDMFPLQLELQKRYKDSLQIILVDSKNTRDTKQRITRFFEAYHPSYKQLACAIEDTVLSKLFPHQTVGYYVWIKNNVVLAMTEEADLTSKNIGTFLTGKQAKIIPIVDLPYDSQKPIYENGNGGEAPRYIYRFIITPYKEGLHSSSRFMFDSDRLCTGMQYVNTPKYSLLVSAFPELQQYEKNRVLIITPNPESFSSDSTSENWLLRNAFTYKALFPAVSQTKALQFMRNDLENIFQVHLDSTIRDTLCMVIKLIKKAVTPKLILSGKRYDPKDENFIRDFPLSVIISELNSKSKIPFVDESNYSGTIRMTFEFSNLTIQEIIQKLRLSGLAVDEEKRDLKFMVLSSAANSK